MAYRTSCAVCLDLKGDPFDRGLNIKGDHFSRVDIKEVGPSRDRGCPGCVIISWILEPYMDKVFGKSAEVRLRLRGDHYLCYSGTRYPREVIAELEVMATPRDIDDGHIWERKAQQ